MNIYLTIDKAPTKTSIYQSLLSLLENNFPGVSHISAHLIKEALATSVLNYFLKDICKANSLRRQKQHLLPEQGEASLPFVKEDRHSLNSASLSYNVDMIWSALCCLVKTGNQF